MNDSIMIALISGGSAIIGGVVGGTISFFSQKMIADREDRRRSIDFARRKALERIEKLYKPLLAMLNPGPPYDDFCIDRELGGRLIKHIDENDLFASPDMLEAIWEFKHEFYEGTGAVSSDLQHKILIVASREYKELKSLLGYGRILKKVGAFKRICKLIIGGLMDIYRKARKKLFIRRARRRAKKFHS